MLFQSNTSIGLLSLLLLDDVRGQAPIVSNDTVTFSGFEPASMSSFPHAFISNFFKCDALVSANLFHVLHLASSPLYPTLVEGSWTKNIQRSPYCFVTPSTTTEVSRALVSFGSAGNGAGDWHIAVRSGGHGSDNQNSITDGVIIDLSRLNATVYDEATKVASIGTGARWGDVYADLEEHGVCVTGGRQSVVGVGGLTLGGGVGWTTPRTVLWLTTR